MPTTKPDTETGWTTFVIVDTDRGSEVWRDIVEDKLVAIFTERSDADFFAAVSSASQSHEDKIRNAAFNIASAFPDLNYSNQPINPNGELVGRIAQVIRADFPSALPSPSDFEQLLRLRAALQEIADRDTLCTCEHDTEFCCVRVGHYCAFCIAATALREVLANTGEQS